MIMLKCEPVKVLSVPIKQTAELVDNYLIHACPAHNPYFSYPAIDYITFRYKGGLMHKIYKYDKDNVLILDPLDNKALLPYNIHDYYLRLESYILGRRAINDFTKEEYRFYILDSSDAIDLLHSPKSEFNSPRHFIYTLDELTSGKHIVRLLSKCK